jgi:hypothetical protein
LKRILKVITSDLFEYNFEKLKLQRRGCHHGEAAVVCRLFSGSLTVQRYQPIRNRKMSITKYELV